MKSPVYHTLKALGILSLSKVYLREINPQETVITCTGSWDDRKKLYDMLIEKPGTMITGIPPTDGSLTGTWIHGLLVINLFQFDQPLLSASEMKSEMDEMDAGHPSTFDAHLQAVKQGEYSAQVERRITPHRIKTFLKKSGCD